MFNCNWRYSLSPDCQCGCNESVGGNGSTFYTSSIGIWGEGCLKAALHAYAKYMRCLCSNCILKLDFKNVFNSIQRDKVLEEVQSFAPIINPFINSAYSLLSMLVWEDMTIDFAEGVQQGDPLGPLLFCLTKT